MRRDTEAHCHCSARYNGSDHCPECGCEQYESGDCGWTTTVENAEWPSSLNSITVRIEDTPGGRLLAACLTAMTETSCTMGEAMAQVRA